MPTMAENFYEIAKVCSDSGLTLETQSVSITGGTPESGNFTLTFDGETTGNIAFDATASQLQSALEALDNIQSGDVSCSGGPLPGSAVTVQFQGRLEGAVPEMTASDVDLSAGSPAISTSQAGADGLRKDLRQAFEAFDSAMGTIWSTAGTKSYVIAAHQGEMIKLCRRFATELRDA